MDIEKIGTICAEVQIVAQLTDFDAQWNAHGLDPDLAIRLLETIKNVAVDMNIPGKKVIAFTLAIGVRLGKELKEEEYASAPQG